MEREKVYDFIRKWEGGAKYTNVQGDPGGLTYRGITFATFQTLGNKLLGVAPTKENFLALTDADFKKFVDYFFEVSKANEIKNLPIAALHVDAFFNSGKWANFIFNKTFNKVYSANLKLSGAKTNVDTSTIDLLNRSPQKTKQRFFETYFENRELFYRNIVQAKPETAKFLKGWLNRIADLKKTFPYEISLFLPLVAVASLLFFLLISKK